MRQELYRLLEQPQARAGLRREDFRAEDRGDGVLVLLNSDVPKTRVLPWLVLRMAAELNRYNRTAPEATRIRVRAVVHAGEVDALARMLRTLGFEGRDIPVEEAAARFRSRVAGRRILLVLDNAVSAGQVRHLLPASPTCAVLITSRQVLSTLDGARHVHLDVLRPEQAVQLLGRVAGVERLTAEPRAAADVARQCDYLPLALRIAGARLAARPSWPVHARPSASVTNGPDSTSWSRPTSRYVPASRSATGD
jgi:hypothetical protein